MSDEKGVEYSQENNTALFKELALDPSDHTSGRLAKRSLKMIFFSYPCRYANQDGVLDAAAVHKLLVDYRSALVQSVSYFLESLVCFGTRTKK